MTQVITDLWPYLVTALFAAVGWQFRESYLLKTKVAVTERTIENILKTIEAIQHRQDSHSKKQDDIMDLLTSFKMEMLKEVGNMSSNVSGLASDVKNLSNLISITEIGIKVDRNDHHKK